MGCGSRSFHSFYPGRRDVSADTVFAGEGMMGAEKDAALTTASFFVESAIGNKLFRWSPSATIVYESA